MAESVSAWTVLVRSPYEIFGRENQAEQQSFLEMLKNILAPYYKFKSITTVLMCINAILYITLVCRFPPFLSIPSFALQPLQLMPEHLRHFEFYRMLTAPFVYKDLSTLLLYTVLVWSLGSYTQKMMGKRLLVIFTGFSGLVGLSNNNSIPTFMIGANFALAIMHWPDPHAQMVYRKIMLVIYLVTLLVYILIFLNNERGDRISIYSSTFMGTALTFIMGCENDPVVFTTFRKLLKSASTILLLGFVSILIINLVFANQTLI